MPKLTRKQLAKLITDWNTIAKSTLECRTCDRFYETPFEWLGKKEKAAFIDHLYDYHLMLGSRTSIRKGRKKVMGAKRRRTKINS
jgi:hypothetical protein